MELERKTTRSLRNTQEEDHHRAGIETTQLDQQFEVEVDASGYAIGAVLMQRDQKGKRHPIA